jgi:hypothetical protein
MTKVKGNIYGPFESWSWKCSRCGEGGFNYSRKEDAIFELKKHNKTNKLIHKYINFEKKK